MPIVVATATLALRLNESPSEKEGKCAMAQLAPVIGTASMKALLKRKGNRHSIPTISPVNFASMKALLKRKGNAVAPSAVSESTSASMKALLKRKGN